MINNKNDSSNTASTSLILEHLNNLTQQLQANGLTITFGSIVVVDKVKGIHIASHKPKRGNWWLNSEDYGEYLETRGSR